MASSTETTEGVEQGSTWAPGAATASSPGALADAALRASARAGALPDSTDLHGVLLALGARPQHLKQALDRAKQTGESLPTIMRDFGFVGEETVAKALAAHHGYDYFEPGKLAEIALLRPGHPAERPSASAGYVPAHESGGRLIVVVSDIARVNEAANAYYLYQPRIAIASTRTMQTLYRRRYGNTAEEFDQAVEALSAFDGRSSEEAPGLVQDIFFALMRHACYSGASDIYLFKSEAVGIIKLRVNGVGQLFRSVTADLHDKILNKLVTESGVKAEELRRAPQEALVHFHGDRVRYEELLSRYAFRMELVQTRAESNREAVIRILDRQSSEAEFAHLGFDVETERTLRRYLAASTGLVIVTGPTGSGKTTTLYGMLKEIDPVERSVQTIENPIEYRHGLWMQHEVSREVSEGEGVRQLLNAVLRMAPDVILFGEVRNDREVAEMLIDAANTGHLVFTTLHTNSAVLAVNRLRSIGVSPEGLAAVLKGVVGQRLVQTLCSQCAIPDDREETAVVLRQAGASQGVEVCPRRAVGCSSCGFSGYRGRSMIYELLDVTSAVRELIEAGASASSISRCAMLPSHTMWACGLRLVARGVTALEEVRRVAEPNA